MAFKDLTQIIEPLQLPIGGKTYTVPPVGYRDGLRMQAALLPDAEDTITDEEFLQIFLGSALEQLRADDVPPQYVTRAAMAAHTEWATGSRSTAEVMWETGGDPLELEAWKAAQLRSKPQDRQPKASTPSTATGAARKTRSRASGTGTRTSPKS